MQNYFHKFIIPVMGTGHSIDSPIRVAPYGISSVISMLDDILMEDIREYYCKKHNFEFVKIARKEFDGRAKRVTAYLETVKEIVNLKIEEIKNMPFFEDNEKAKYFEMLPDDGILKQTYRKLQTLTSKEEREKLAKELTAKITPGSIDVNIMVKVDPTKYNKDNSPMSEEFSDAKSALRGYANSSLESSVVFSAGINQSLFAYMTKFRDFYRNEKGEIKKKIIIKVSDFRSALIQGKYLAKKGLEISEFRIESGLNCGGHAFSAKGSILPVVLKEFAENRDKFRKQFKPFIRNFYDKMGWEFVEKKNETEPLITVQGGIGNHGEVERLFEEFKIDQTGWASPFLLVPEATCIDDPTLQLLINAKEEDLYLSDVSPLGIPFNNIRNTGSEIWTKERIAKGTPGSPCPKKFAVTTKEFTETEICTASRQYQKLKLDQIEASENYSFEEKQFYSNAAMERTCICAHLGNGALIALGIENDPKKTPQSICPGPNIAWFNRKYSLKEMVDHIYGRIASLVPEERPHFFAKELSLNINFFEKKIRNHRFLPFSEKEFNEYKKNIQSGFDYCRELTQKTPFKFENIESLKEILEDLEFKFDHICLKYQNQLEIA